MSFDEEHLDNHHECRGAYEMEKRAKDGAYAERNKLVCLLSKIFPASIEDHLMLEGQEWDEDWRKVIFIELPTGQCTWHIHKSEEPMFSHLFPAGRKWDGHTTETKYKRIERIHKVHIDTIEFNLVVSQFSSDQ